MSSPVIIKKSCGHFQTCEVHSKQKSNNSSLIWLNIGTYKLICCQYFFHVVVQTCWKPAAESSIVSWFPLPILCRSLFPWAAISMPVTVQPRWPGNYMIGTVSIWHWQVLSGHNSWTIRTFSFMWCFFCFFRSYSWPHFQGLLQLLSSLPAFLRYPHWYLVLPLFIRSWGVSLINPDALLWADPF